MVSQPTPASAVDPVQKKPAKQKAIFDPSEAPPETVRNPQPKGHSDWSQVTLEEMSSEQEMVPELEIGGAGKVTQGRPHKTHGFRVSTRPEWSRTWDTLELEEAEAGGKPKRTTYLTTKTVAAQVEKLAEKTLVPRRLALWQNHRGQIGVWSVGILGGDNDWVLSARRIIAAAAVSWVRVQSDMTEGRYRGFAFPARTDEPTWPEWTLDFQEVLKRAFGHEKLITSLDHPALANLLGGEI